MKLSKTSRPLNLALIAMTLFGLSSCQILLRGSGENQGWKYSLKKRKTHISCLEEGGSQPVIKTLPLEVSERSLDRLISSIDDLTGASYRPGGSDSDGFDCSGFVEYLYKKEFKMILPRTAGEQAPLGSAVPENKQRPGDLVFFSISGQRIDHVGIFVGKNRFTHAANSGIRIDNMADPYYRSHYATSSRIITVD
jgi:hypothetical protein